MPFGRIQKQGRNELSRGKKSELQERHPGNRRLLVGGGLASDKSQPGFSSCGEQGSRKKMQLEVRSLPAWLLSLNEQAAKSSAKKRGEGVCRTDD